jgi:hypothetical protein
LVFLSPEIYFRLGKDSKAREQPFIQPTGNLRFKVEIRYKNMGYLSQAWWDMPVIPLRR